MTPAEHIIRKLGGTRKAAAIIGVHPSTVQSWKESGFVPARRQREVLDAAARAHIPLLPDDFMIVPTAPDALPAQTCEVA